MSFFWFITWHWFCSILPVGESRETSAEPHTSTPGGESRSCCMSAQRRRQSPMLTCFRTFRECSIPLGERRRDGRVDTARHRFYCLATEKKTEQKFVELKTKFPRSARMFRTFVPKVFLILNWQRRVVVSAGRLLRSCKSCYYPHRVSQPLPRR